MQQIYVSKEYNRDHAVEYALTWALDRNPLFYDFTNTGGDCSSFVSQCLLAGSCVMNFTPDYGWFFISASNRTASWTGVEFLYNFLTQNNGIGPYGTTGTLNNRSARLELGDVIQLGNRNGTYYHTLIVTGITSRTYLVSAHTNDVRNRALNTYSYYRARYIHIEGVRMQMEIDDDCFPDLLNGTSLP